MYLFMYVWLYISGLFKKQTNSKQAAVRDAASCERALGESTPPTLRPPGAEPNPRVGRFRTSAIDESPRELFVLLLGMFGSDPQQS